MCCICDGWTPEEAHVDLVERMERFGWALQAVEACRPWVYTVGLTERFGHPELVMAGVPISVAGHALNALGARIAEGERFRAGQKGIAVAEAQVGLVVVHPVHLAAGLVGVWEDHYHRVPPRPALEVLQVVPHPTGGQPRLDQAFTTLDI